MCICSEDGEKSFLQNFFREIKKHRLIENLIESIQLRAEVASPLIVELLKNQVTEIFINGKIYTMDEKNPIAQAIAIKYREIVKVGKNEEVLKLKAPNTKVIDLQGKTMLPGFIDPHVHMTFSMLDHWLDLGPFANKDEEEAGQKLIQAVKYHKNPNLILACQLYDPLIMSGEFDVSREGLDKISKDVGIFILQANGHVAHVNSAALRIAKIDKNTQDPPHGRFVRDSKGELTGEVQQLAVGVFHRYMERVTLEMYKQNFVNFLNKCASKGCTSLHDCGIGFIDPETDLAVLYSVFNEDDPPVRYSGYLVSTGWKAWEKLKMAPSLKDQDLRITGIKCWADGSTQGGSAYLSFNYKIPKWGKGTPNYTRPQLEQSIKKAHDGGWQVGVHSNGDAAIDMVLDCYQAVQKANQKTDLRHRVEHSTICHHDQLVRMKRLGVSPSFLIGHIYYYGEVFQEILGETRARKMDPLKSAFDLGLKPTIHSDYNCQPVDPLRCIHNAVTRRTKVSGKVINEQERVTPHQAIQAMTINAAWQCHKEDIVGSLQEGKLADFVILEEDPMKVDPERIIDIKIDQTWMDGKLTYQSPK